MIEVIVMSHFIRINHQNKMKIIFQPAGLGNANAIGSDEDKTLQIDGTESLVVDTFCKLYNCTLAVSLGLAESVFQYELCTKYWVNANK